MKEQDPYSQLDAFVKGTLSADDRLALEQKMQSDPVFRKQVEDHVRLIDGLKLYGRRQSMLNKLNEIPLDTPREETAKIPPQVTRSIRRLWPMTAVAASVAFLSILGTLYLTQSLKTEQTAIYRELVRNVNDIKKSQSRIIADMTHEKPAPLPPGFVGSGFLVSANGYIVTSYHVVKGADSVFVENSNFGRLKTSVIFSDPANDVSVLKIDSTQTFNLKSLPYMINPMEANLGEDVFTLGFPREDIVFGEGSISATTGYQQNPNSYQVSVPVNPGNSGGPLFNAKGDLVGIISGAQTETSGAAFAIKSSVLLGVIKNLQADSLQSPLNLPRQNSLRYLSKVDQVKKWKEYVFVVQVYNHK